MQIPDYGESISLIPYGLPQFLDFEIAQSKTRKIKKNFLEISLPASGEDETQQTQLVELQRNDEGILLNPDGKGEYCGEDSYIIQATEKDFGPWLNQWLPIPFFHQSGDFDDNGKPLFRSGPTNWARSYVTLTPSPEDPEVLDWRVVLAFDMQVEEQGGKHVALSPDDVTARATCSLADERKDNSWFIREGWIDAWLRSLWDSWYKDKKHVNEKPHTPSGKENKLDYIASYLVYLQFLQTAINNIKVKIVNISGSQDKAADAQSNDPVSVDLILDIGNARSTGILVENQVSKDTDLNDSYRLQLRDLGRPENVYAEPFETRVEFSKVEFGSTAYSRRSGRRTSAFTWASPVRTGPEASRMASMFVNAEGISGMSSPKRYLWDQDKAGSLWYFNRTKQSEREELISSNSICRYLNNFGTPVSCVRELNQTNTTKRYLSKLFQATLPKCEKQDDLPAYQPQFSRSSMMMFLFMELIQQALVTINSPGQRLCRDVHDRPRRLRSIIFTVPPGMSFAEQRIYRRWAYAAIDILWEVLGWKKIFFREPNATGKRSRAENVAHDFRMNPEVRCRWDEATCTQLVYLYNEVTHNYQGDAHLFFEATGRMRKVPQEDAPSKTETRPSLRVATLDIGGGTTDIAITTYVLANDRSSTDRIRPNQEFRDGFNFGGDDVLETIVSNIVLGNAFLTMLTKKGVGYNAAEKVIREMFGKKDRDIRIQNQRIQFLRQVALPIAYEILKLYESMPQHDDSSEICISMRKLFPETDQIAQTGTIDHSINESMEFFSKVIESRLGVAIDMREMDFTIRSLEVDKTIYSIVKETLNSIGEVVHAYDCDILLLTGRPSCWNAIVRHIFAIMPVAPDRVIPMNNYLVGEWYPFANTSGKITDPKTTVVTGAILCALAENSIEGFVFDSNRLNLISTAQYIGELDTNGFLTREKVWFPNKNYDKKLGESDENTKIVEFSSPISIGSRQLEVPRWTAARCWRMEFTSQEALRNADGHTPYFIKIRFNRHEKDESLEDIPEEGLDIRAQLDEPQIAYDTDSDEAVKERKIVSGKPEYVAVGGQPVRILLRTLGKKDEEGCWMDTGVLF